jgi:hypothetical protein
MKSVQKIKAVKTTKTKRPPPKVNSHAAQRAVDAMLDEALDETFPASDPVALTQTSRRRRAELRERPARRH